ncbi:MAG: protein translocase subunit SecD, partial [Alphaproteobacteria bacterium]|nr:protein translocase subunit SecD [Alphaproteobacteria bacterium]MDX5464991.1 protein translocase subunit SecD [Alphaproteobacteria bacterium]
MLYFARWKIIAILAVCLAGLIFALPNVLPRSVLDGLPDVVPNDQVRLGLDLQGGAHLLLELDVEEVYLDRLETVRDDVRDVLRGQTPSIGYTALRVADGAVIVRIRDQAEMETALSRIRGLIGTVDTGMAGIGGGPDLEVSVEENTLVRIVMTEAAQEQRAANTVSQAITVLRRRIDALGTLDPTIQRQGSDRILVQVPGLRDVAGLKQIITETAKMTFHLVDVGVSP